MSNFSRIRNLVFFIASLLLVLVLSAQTGRLFALACGEKPVAYNKELEGAKILSYRKNLIDGNFPKEGEILFAGTSRTMADYDPLAFAQTTANLLHLDHVPISYNLGNVANDPLWFLAQMDKNGAYPKLLILEFSPHLFLYPPSVSNNQSIYNNYQSEVTIQELMTTGLLKKYLGLENSLGIDPSLWFSTWDEYKRIGLDRAEIYYFILASSYGYGQKLGNNGQVLYRFYFPDVDNARKARRVIYTEYEAFKNIHLTGAFQNVEWEAYTNLIEKASKAGTVVVVRPPVDPQMYQLENNMASKVIERVTQYLDQNHILYIDLNPHSYYSSDMSHIDWFDTQRLSQDLAKQISEATGMALFR